MPTLTDLAGPAGRLEAILDEPPLRSGSGEAPGLSIKAAVVFAHPHPEYGGTMHTKAVYQGAKGLTRIGCAVLRFNFRGVGASAGEFDRGPGELEDFKAALDYMAAKYPDAPLWAAGFSFGAWVALEVGAAHDHVSVLIGIAPPIATSVSWMAGSPQPSREALPPSPRLRRTAVALAEAGRRAAGASAEAAARRQARSLEGPPRPAPLARTSGQDYRFENTLASTKPKFFVHGEADEVCPLEAMWRFYGRLQEPKELVVIDAADHLFDGKTQEVGEALEDLLGDY